MINYQFATDSPKSFNAYPKADIDPESNTIRRPRKPKHYSFHYFHFHPVIVIKSFGNRVMYYYKLHPMVILLIVFSFGVATLILLSVYTSHISTTTNKLYYDGFPFAKLRNLVMVAGHSIYTSSSCEKVDREDSWFLESYQRNVGQAATFVAHIKEGVEVAANDEDALLLFSGGETRKDAGPRSEAQSYWMVAESKGWFGYQEKVRWKALTEEHARDSFENLLFSVCRFRELTGSYPQNITVVGYDFKKERFVNLHRSAIRFPELRFFYLGTPAATSSREAASKGEALVRTQFEHDPYACLGSLRRKKIGRDPFHRSIPYPNGCPEIEGLFRYCRASLYTGSLPWA
ncbi:hypothetical protein HanIR_Chr02g0071881 [Helianthus annuus]|nr:hypothetical protein HanIR_Chr02g0071881 [Helianthus annuus]